MDRPVLEDLQVALDKGDLENINILTEIRNQTDIPFELPSIPARKCEIEISFLNSSAQIDNSFCGTVESLILTVNTSNTYYLVNLSLKKIYDWYVLEDDLDVLNNYKKIIGIPVHRNVYALIDKEEYDTDYPSLYYGLYTRTFWKLYNKIAPLSYQNFKRKPEREMISMINLLISSVVVTKDRVFDEDEEYSDPDELEQILYVPEDII